MSCWTSETGNILKSHQGDFDYKNWQTVLKKYNGYEGYLKAIGGVFRKWVGKTAKVKTVAEFQEICQYVFGLMALYGFNYNNEKTHVRWGGEKPFYPTANDGKCNWGRIDDLCSRADLDKTTNCNFGVDAICYKAGLAPKLFDYSYRYKWLARNYPVIRKKADLKVGDLVHFFHCKINSDNPDTWGNDKWGHVAIVGEVTDGKVVLYDTGNRFIRTGDFKKVFTVDKNNKPTGEYDNYDGWAANHIVDLKYKVVKTDSELAVEVIAGLWGSNAVRKAKLGRRYDIVQHRVNYFLKSDKTARAAYLRAAAGYVLKGYAGTEQDRVKFFGKNYKDVQNKVNWVIKTANDVIDGKYGNNAERKAALGIDYDLVQAQVNRMV